MAKYEVISLDKRQMKRNQLRQNIERFGYARPGTFDLLSPRFFNTRTCFPDLKSFLAYGGLEANSQEDLVKLPVQVIDALVSSKTNFKSWNDMLKQASVDFASSVYNDY